MNSKIFISLLVFLTVAGFFLFTEHKAHALGILPYLFFLLCPIMHIFMHSGHGGHGDTDKNSHLTKHNHDKQ